MDSFNRNFLIAVVLALDIGLGLYFLHSPELFNESLMNGFYILQGYAIGIFLALQAFRFTLYGIVYTAKKASIDATKGE